MARYIDVDKLIEEMKKENALVEYDEIEEYAEENTEDVAPVAYGKWLPDGVSLKCSLCGKWFVIEQGDAETNFCINCGARMEE